VIFGVRSGIKDWTLQDFVRHIMDKEMEQRLQQMMERLLTRQMEEFLSGQREMLALVGESRTCENGTTLCQVSSVACPDNSWIPSKEVQTEWRPRTWKLLQKKQRPQWCGKNSLKKR
jgi:hypothetical protein